MQPRTRRCPTLFCNFFSSRVAAIAVKIRSILASGTILTSAYLEHHTPTRPVGFGDVSNEEAIRAILIVPAKTSAMDYISTLILKGACDVFGPLIAKLANLSFSQGTFPTMFKVGQLTPLPKKPGISGDDLSNYRPIMNLNAIGKIWASSNEANPTSHGENKTSDWCRLHEKRSIRPKPPWWG